MAHPNRRRWTMITADDTGIIDISQVSDVTSAIMVAEAGRYQDALNLLDQLDSYDRPDLCHARASILTHLGRDSEAVGWYQRTIDAVPLRPEPWADKAGCHYRLQQYGEAILCAEQAVKLLPEDEIAWLWMAKAYHALGQNKVALGTVDRAPQKVKQSVHILLEKASLLAEASMAGDERSLTAAIQLTKEVIKQNPDCDAAWYNQGVYFGMCGEYQKALEAFHQAKNHCPDDKTGDIWREIGVTYLLLDPSCPDAEMALKEALKRIPGDEVATLNLGVFYLLKNDIQKVLKLLDRALHLNPFSEPLRDLREKVAQQMSSKK
jgi:tetratricopeptide (TPR) repeat protein